MNAAALHDDDLGWPRPSRGRRPLDPLAAAGLIVTLLLHGGLIGTVIYLRHVQTAAPPPPQSFVVARLVRLGKRRDRRLLPRKIVPQPAMKPRETVNLNADANDAPQPKKPPKPKPDRDAVLGDRMRQSLDRAAIMQQGEEEIEAEGDPNGVAGGTATEGSEGDVYITRIADLWIRTWSLPAIIPRDEAQQLYALVVLQIDKDGTIQLPIHFDRPSGNSYFDDSIRNAWQRIGRLPLPPPDRLPSILAHGLALKLTWRGVQ